MFKFVKLVVSLALSAFVAWPALAREKPPYLVDAWTTENGLPQNTILSIAQTSDGYLWVGTFNGLARFDGVRFTVFDPLNTPELHSARIIDLQSDGKGGIWIFSEEGYLTHLFDGHFEEYNGRHGLPDLRFACSSSDPDDNVWLTCREDNSKIFRAVGKEFVLTSMFTNVDVSLPSNVFSARRAFWVRETNWWQRADGTILKESAALGEFGRALNWSPSTDGDVLGIFHDRVDWLRSKKTLKFSDGARIDADVTHLLLDAEGNMVAATWGEGVMIIHPDGKLYKLPLIGGPIARNVRILFIDREGDRWVGTDTAGLQRIKSRVFKTYLPEDGLSGEVIRSLDTSPKDEIWIVPVGGIDIQTKEGEFTHFLQDNHDWWAANHGRDGDYWTGSYGGMVARLNDSGYEEVKTTVASVRVVAPHHSKGVWIGGTGGFGHADGNQFTPMELPAEIKKPFVRAVVDAGPEELWVGLYEEGIFRHDSKGWHRFGRKEGLKDDQVVSLYRDAEGVIWVGTSFGGLNRLKDGRFTNFQEALSSMPSRVSSIIEDELGYLWLASLNGIHRVSRRELNDLADGKINNVFIRQFTRADGLETSECSESRQPTSCKTKDGKLWFATINGLAVIDPRNLPANPLAPPVAIEEVLVDGKIVSQQTEAAAGKRSLALKPGASHVEIHYTAVTLQSAEKARFRYRLSGLYNEWVDAGSRRFADYNKLPPGSYTFQVAAANNAGIWNERGQSMELIIEPLFYQTYWFKALVVAWGAAVVIAAYKARIATLKRERLMQEEFSRKLIESQEHERSRIAHELHDGLGQDLLVIKNYAVLGLSAGKENGNSHYETISETASEAIQQVRDISHDLRPYQLEHLGPTAAIRGIYKRLAEGPIRFEALVENIDALFSKEDASHVFRILQELTNNILKHSRATEATVIVEARESVVRIQVIDNGLGLNGAPKAAGLGLRGITERVRILGGTMHIDSPTAGGTRVEITIPSKQPKVSM